METLENERGSKIENESEIERLKILKNNYETEVENNKKKITALEKIAKNREKYQRKVDRERATLTEKEKDRNLVEERLNSTKPLEDLKERESELRQQNAEDQEIIDATDTSPSEKEAAEVRVEEEIRSSRVCKLRSWK